MQVDRLSSALLNLGLEQGDYVALWVRDLFCSGVWSTWNNIYFCLQAPNYEFWYVSMLAIARAGLVCVSQSFSYLINSQ